MDSASGELPLRPQEWTVAHVKSFLVAVGLSELEATFEAHDVNGAVLLSLTEEDAERSLNIQKFGVRRRLSLALQELKEGLEPKLLSNSKRYDGFTKSTNASLTFTMTEFSQLEDGTPLSSLQPSPLRGFAPSKSNERLAAAAKNWHGTPSRLDGEAWGAVPAGSLVWAGCGTPRTPAQPSKAGRRQHMPSSSSKGELQSEEGGDGDTVLIPSPNDVPRISTRLVSTPPWPTESARKRAALVEGYDALSSSMHKSPVSEKDQLNSSGGATRCAIIRAPAFVTVIPPPENANESSSLSDTTDPSIAIGAGAMPQKLRPLEPSQPQQPPVRYASPVRMASVPEPVVRTVQRGVVPNRLTSAGQQQGPALSALVQSGTNSPGQPHPAVTVARWGTSQSACAPSTWSVPSRVSVPVNCRATVGAASRQVAVSTTPGHPNFGAIDDSLPRRQHRATTPAPATRKEFMDALAAGCCPSPPMPLGGASAPSSLLVAQAQACCASPPVPGPGGALSLPSSLLVGHGSLTQAPGLLAAGATQNRNQGVAAQPGVRTLNMWRNDAPGGVVGPATMVTAPAVLQLPKDNKIAIGGFHPQPVRLTSSHAPAAAPSYQPPKTLPVASA